MENIIFYTDRYQAVNLIAENNVKFVNIIPPLTAELDLFISDQIINNVLKEHEYKNIYIPISPFSSFTDYLGLHIALFIKVSDSKNKLSNIFIYGSDTPVYVLNNECLEVFKFKEVTLIDFSKEAMTKTLNSDLITTESIWFHQINNMQLSIPEDYFDNHSIANEWGIYQMARNADINIKEVEGVDFNKFQRLYCKWLIFKNKLNESIPVEQKQEQTRYTDQLQGLRIKGMIDVTKFKKK